MRLDCFCTQNNTINKCLDAAVLYTHMRLTDSTRIIIQHAPVYTTCSYNRLDWKERMNEYRYYVCMTNSQSLLVNCCVSSRFVLPPKIAY